MLLHEGNRKLQDCTGLAGVMGSECFLGGGGGRTLVSRGSSCDIPRMQMDVSVVTAGARKTPPPPRLSELARGGVEVGYWCRFEDPRGESCLQQGP